MGLSFVALGCFFYIKFSHGGQAPHYLGWLPLVSVIVFIVAFAVGIGPLSWTIMGEILHPNIKGLTSYHTNIINNAFCSESELN
jgi:facilitated trehalose transporter